MPADIATLWFAGKQMLPEKKLSEYLGRHEKTKAVVKLQKKGQGAPAREPVGPGLHAVVLTFHKVRKNTLYASCAIPLMCQVE